MWALVMALGARCSSMTFIFLSQLPIEWLTIPTFFSSDQGPSSPAEETTIPAFPSSDQGPPTSIEQTSPLLQLPQELLDEILSHVIGAHFPAPRVYRGRSAWRFNPPANIMIVCRRIHAAASAILFRRHFMFPCTGLRDVRWLMQRVPIEHRHHIRSVRNARFITASADHGREMAAAEDRKYGLCKGTC